MEVYFRVSTQSRSLPIAWIIGSRLLTCWNGRIFPAFPLPFVFADGLSFTQSGMITARISSWTVIPRSSASVVRSLKFSSRRDNMNFAKESPSQRGVVGTAAVNIKIPKKSTEYFSLKRVKTDGGIPINLGLILLTEERASPPTRLLCEN